MAVSVFGKAPLRGDFISRRTPADLEAAWRTWIAAGFDVSRRRAGPAWLEHYHAAPAWRFALAPAPNGAPALCGVIAPSADAEGRAFPLTIFAQAADAAPAMARLFRSVNRWAPAAEAAAFSTGAAGADFEAFIAEVDALEQLWAAQTRGAGDPPEDLRDRPYADAIDATPAVLQEAVENLGPGRLFWYAETSMDGAEGAFGMLHHAGALDPEDWVTLLLIEDGVGAERAERGDHA